MNVTVEQFASQLNLKVLRTSETAKERLIQVPDICRPGLQFAGYFDVFAYERPQLIGKTEMAFLKSLNPEIRTKRLERYFSYELPCVVIARGMSCPEEMKRIAGTHAIPIYGTQEVTSTFSADAIEYLAEAFAPHENRHGVLMDVFGVGVLITGDSGVGKSECALELINHGHQLVADDVVDFSRIGTSLFGEAPEVVRDLMELRGVGIVDVKKIFGIGAVVRRKKLDLIIHIAMWQDGKNYDRLGRSDLSENILGIDVPMMDVPVRPGRSLATIVEIAARRWALAKEGYEATEELDQRLWRKYGTSESKTE
ncbi:MAG: HPr(Ser) kinase/phosphatase [Clostridia bacterium]|nr:HPr(Ser) kinase/phosphatase [Clostridia bacterium]